MVDANSKRPKYSRNKCNKCDDINRSFKIFHQNIRGIKGKINELMISLLNDELSIICLSEHHLNVEEMDVTHIPKYKFGSGYGRKMFKNGDVCIFVQEDQNFTSLNLQKYCKECDIEIAAIKAELNEEKIIVLCISAKVGTNFADKRRSLSRSV
jgi:DNA-binding FrmR family transcriptional regulator